MFRILNRWLVVVVMTAAAGCGQGGGSNPSSETETPGDPGVPVEPAGSWVAGDFHNHTFLTDGSHTEADVVAHAFDPALGGLDWLANSEHGGAYSRDPLGQPWDPATTTLLGDPVTDVSGRALMWRWQSLRDYSFPLLFDPGSGLQARYPDRVLVQGVEWNVPAHEHASVGIVGQASGSAIADFEYRCDQDDRDTSRSSEGLVKQNAGHADALACASFLESRYPHASYLLINHPSRTLAYSVADLRDFNNAAPDVAFGFEGLPGHQKAAERGEYSGQAKTYGGADVMVARLGGLWDSLLGEGRRFWVFVNSDFHGTTNDFYPGEYAKNYTHVTQKSAEAIVAGMRAGNTFAVVGDLIDALDFHVDTPGAASVAMGGEATLAAGEVLIVTIRFKSPARNNHGDTPLVDHVDLIAGDITGRTSPADPAYDDATNPSTEILARFTSRDWTIDGEGYATIVHTIQAIDRDCYLRLRGTNLGLGVPNQTDAAGNPLSDELLAPNDADKAYADLWFYSNPIFVYVE